MRGLVLTALMLSLLGTSLDAQVCEGMAPFDNGPMRVGGTARFVQGGHGLAGSFGLGDREGGFGSLSLGAVVYENQGTSTTVGGEIGWQVGLGRTRTLQLCPIATAMFELGPNDVGVTDVDLSARDLSFGVGMGATVHRTPRFQLIPAGALAFVHAMSAIDGVDVVSGSRTYWLVSLGVGLVVNQVVTIRPGLSIPIDEFELIDHVFGVTVGLNFGARR